MSIRAFIMDEVERQGFKRGSSDFWFRVGAMMAAWNHALTGPPLTAETVQLWGMMVEPEENRNGFRDCGVYVGGRECPNWTEVPRLMAAWEEGLARLTPDEAYLEFEGIHPFRDGNGRTGKIIHNTLMETLRHPVLVKDYFGGGNP
jgi:hypothetical protein